MTKMTFEEFVRSGGNAFKEKYGSEAYSEMGKKGGKTTKEKYGKDHYSRLGQLGAKAKKEKKNHIVAVIAPETKTKPENTWQAVSGLLFFNY